MAVQSDSLVAKWVDWMDYCLVVYLAEHLVAHLVCSLVDPKAAWLALNLAAWMVVVTVAK